MERYTLSWENETGTYQVGIGRLLSEGNGKISLIKRGMKGSYQGVRGPYQKGNKGVLSRGNEGG